MTVYAAANPDFEQAIHDSFLRQQAMQLIGATLQTVRPGYVTIELPYRPDLTQQNGFFHAGILTTVMDSAGGYAAYSLMPAGTDVLSVEFKVNMLAPATGEKLVARAEVIRAGRTLTVCQSNGYAVQADGQEKHCAVMQMTLIQVNGV